MSIQQAPPSFTKMFASGKQLSRNEGAVEARVIEQLMRVLR